MKNIPHKLINYHSRDCDICGSKEHDCLWEYPYMARTANCIFHWKVRIVICVKCGFVFTSPVPQEKSLEQYYGDGLGLFNEQLLDYSIDKRLDLIYKYSTGKSARYLEIGSNNCPQFAERLSEKVGSISTVELIEECDSDHHNLAEVSDQSADILVAYFVLEHIPAPIKFLEDCYRVLADNGIFIVEVPDLYLYPEYTDALILWEHTNHFSIGSFTAMAERCGFMVMEADNSICSRPFGFTAVLRKNINLTKAITDRCCDEYERASLAVQKGLERHRNYKNHLVLVRKKVSRYSAAGKLSVLWAANNVCQRLLEGFELPEKTLILDIDERKQKLFSPIPVAKPEDRIADLNKCALLVINSARHEAEISNWIRKHTDNDLRNTEIVVLGGIVLGER